MKLEMAAKINAKKATADDQAADMMAKKGS